MQFCLWVQFSTHSPAGCQTQRSWPFILLDFCPPLLTLVHRAAGHSVFVCVFTLLGGLNIYNLNLRHDVGKGEFFFVQRWSWIQISIIPHLSMAWNPREHLGHVLWVGGATLHPSQHMLAHVRKRAESTVPFTSTTLQLLSNNNKYLWY